MTATRLTEGTTILYCLQDCELLPVFCWTREVIEEVLASARVELVGVVDEQGRVVIQEDDCHSANAR